MGQNYSTATVVDGNAGIDVPQLADLTYRKSLGSARFLKTIQARSSTGDLVVVKVFVKPLPTFRLDSYRRKIQREQEALANNANALTHHRVIETDRACYLVRQFLVINLYDRISTRPFLETIEKRWIAFQLLCGLRDCHAQTIHHGDIKTENILVTSWNWVYLSDFASFKPTYLPDDNPANFSYFFDTSGRRTCYIAPERFVAERRNGGEITDAMDIFSLGCVIAELFLEGTPLFTLSQLFKYRKGEYDPQLYLAKIEDVEIRNMVHHMINIDPTKRNSAEEYISHWRRKAFPEYFYSFLYQYIGFITDATAGRADATCNNVSDTTRADERLDRLYHDFDKISYLLEFEHSQQMEKRSTAEALILPVYLDIPNYQRNSSAVQRRSIKHDDGSLIVLNVIATFIRNTSRATGRIRGCDMILAIAEQVSDEAKMDRCLPYLINLLGDSCNTVIIAAIRSVTQLMELVEVVTPINAHIFREYILPKIQHCAVSESPAVRAAYALCLASLASNVSRFLDMTQALHADGVLPAADPEAEVSDVEATFQSLYDLSRNGVFLFFQEHCKLLLTDEDSAVRRAFLQSVSSLCVFFGKSKANDILLSHLNTYLNDENWMLRSEFFEIITGVAAYVGAATLEQYIMPLMVQSLTDPEDFVVQKVLGSLATMAELGLLQRHTTWKLIEIVGRFTLHPNIWIREGAVGFIAASTKWLSPADLHCNVFPLVSPFLRAQVIDLTPLNVLGNLTKPLSRTVFDMAVTWAVQWPKAVYWRDAASQTAFEFETADFIPGNSAGEVPNTSNQSAFGTIEDSQWLSKFRGLGLRSDEAWKVTALREYIWRMAHSRPKSIHSAELSTNSTKLSLNKVLQLQQDLKLQMRTIFFEESPLIFNSDSSTISSSMDHCYRPTNFTDVLRDTSKSTGSIKKVNSNKLRSHEFSPYISPLTTSQPNSELMRASSRKDLENYLNLDPEIGTKDENSSLAKSLVLGGRTLRHRTSTISLLNKGTENSKAVAETSTVTAFGTVELPFNLHNIDSGTLVCMPTESHNQFRGAYSYDGDDPNMFKLLDSMYLQNYPRDIMEFGPTIIPYRRRQPIKKSSPRVPGSLWRPEGILIARFGEHNGAINRVVVASDQTFFLTGSDDGTVKLWDSSRLEKNVSFKASQTYQHSKSGAVGVNVKSLCFIENTRCFVSGGSDGSIHLVKVDDQRTLGRYGRLRQLRNWQLPGNESAVWVEHFMADIHSLLLIATDASNVYALDLRTMQVLFTLKNPVSHGALTCFCVDRKRIWLVVGTSRGILDMWDLRFQMRVKAWGLPGSNPIHRLSLHPSNHKAVIVAGGTSHGELSVWDVEKVQCREVFRVGNSKDLGRSYEPWHVDDEPVENLMARFSASLDYLATAGSGIMDSGIHAFATGEDVTISVDSHEAKPTPGFIISAGVDRKIRFWNLARVERSMIVNGPEDEPTKPHYSANHPTRGLVINIEHIGRAYTEDNLGSSSNTKKSTTKPRAPRSSVISMHQQQLLKSHLDSISDVSPSHGWMYHQLI